MRKILFLPLLLMLLFWSCSVKLKFDGSTFYTVKGKIVDSTKMGIPNLKLTVYNSTYMDVGGLDYGGGEAISAKCTTDYNGNFQVTFPSSNGYAFIQMPSGYTVVNVPYYYGNLGEAVSINYDSANDFLITMPIIQIK